MDGSELVANVPNFSVLAHVLISLNEILPEQEQNAQDLRHTRGLYTIGCKAFNPQKKKNVEDKFLMSSDLFLNGAKRFKSWQEFCETAYNEQAAEYKAVRWLLNNTDISKTHFDLVEQGENVNLPFSIDIKQYALKLARKAGEDKPRLEMLKDKNLLAIRKGSNNL